MKTKWQNILQVPECQETRCQDTRFLKNNVKYLQNCIKIFVKNKIYNKTMKTK